MSIRLRALTCLLALTACHPQRSEKAKDPAHPPGFDRVHDKADFYLEHAGEAADEAGFLYDRCDSLEFTAIAAAVGYPVELTKAQGEAGRWYRHADHECFDRGDSASDISGDMILGLAWWIWQTENRQAASELVAYGKEHTWRMGRGDVFRTILRPPLIALLYDISRTLGADPGPTPPSEVLQSLSLPTPTGYEADLQVVHILLTGAVHCGVSPDDLDALRRQAERQPRNALFQAAYHLYGDGDQTAAYALLDDDAYFPAGRLPTRRDRCEGWLWHRDDGSDWQPCPDDPRVGTPHAGLELRWALAVADNTLRSCR